MLSVKWSEQSKQRIFQIADFIALDSPKAAEEWIDLIISKEKLIRGNPKIGRIVPEIGSEDTRELIVGQYRLMYETDPQELLILTVINCREQRYFKK